MAREKVPSLDFYARPTLFFFLLLILESLEALLMCHPAVDDATVTGFDVKGIGHLPRAYVVIKKGYSATAEEILSYANARYQYI